MNTQKANPPLPQAAPPRPIRRIILFFLAFGLAIAVIIGLTVILVYNSYAAPRHEGKAILAGITVAPFSNYNSESVYPVGLTAGADGSLYVSLFGKGEVDKLDASGKQTPFVAPSHGLVAPGPLSIGPDKNLYVINYSSIDLRVAVGSLWRVTPDGEAAPFGASPGGKPLPLFSQLAVDSAGSIFVTDPSSAQVWRFDPSGTGSLWWVASNNSSAQAQPTGIVYDAAHSQLIISDAGTGSVYRLDDKANTPGGNPLLMFRQSDMDIQGLALDDQGRLLMAVWEGDNGQLIRLETNGAQTILADGFRAPTAIVYRSNNVYVANSDLIGISPPILGFIPSPLKAEAPFTVDLVSIKPGS